MLGLSFDQVFRDLPLMQRLNRFAVIVDFGMAGEIAELLQPRTLKLIQ